MKGSKQKLLYVYEERIPEGLRALVLSFIPRTEFYIDTMTYETPSKEKIDKIKWAEIVLFAPGRYLDDEFFFHARHIKLMQLWSSGYDKFNVAGASKYGIPVANNGGANAASVAEHTIMLMLAVYKWLPDSNERTVTGNWKGNSHGIDMFMLKDKKLGIIGFGNIGRQVAKKVRGFEMKTIYYDIVRPDKKTEREYGVSFSSLDELFKESDIITIHLHLNKETKNLVSEREFGLMKKKAVLINVSRAQIVDQQALYRALRDKKIHGAGLDVYSQEPTRENDPLLNLPNVVATPHMAGSTYDAYLSAMRNVVENFRRVRGGKAPLWIVS